MSDEYPADGNGEPDPINAAMAWVIGRELRNVGGRRMSDQELGRRIGVSKNTIQRLMAGESDFDMVRLFRIARVLGIAPEDLIRQARMRLVDPLRDSD